MRAFTAAALLAIAVAAASACSVVSGWKDLQTQSGTQPASTPTTTGTVSPNPTDSTGTGTSGGPPPPDSPDAAPDQTPAPPTGVSCGNTTCTPDQGCCDDGSKKTCTTQQHCVNDIGGTFTGCRTPADCAANTASPICCYDDFNETTSCTSSCSGATRGVVCTGSPQVCGGKQCLPFGLGVQVCQ